MEVYLLLSGAVVFILVLIFRDKTDATPPRTTQRAQSATCTAPTINKPPQVQPTSNNITPPRQSKPLPSMPADKVLRGKCHVIDGDTIVIQRIKIRLAGIDAPELNQPWGQKSKWAMVGICKGKVITARLSGERSYDRLIGTCFCPEGRDIGAELIKQGLALDGGIFSGGKYRHLEPHGIRKKMMFVRYQRR